MTEEKNTTTFIELDRKEIAGHLRQLADMLDSDDTLTMTSIVALLPMNEFYRGVITLGYAKDPSTVAMQASMDRQWAGSIVEQKHMERKAVAEREERGRAERDEAERIKTARAEIDARYQKEMQAEQAKAKVELRSIAQQKSKYPGAK